MAHSLPDYSTYRKSTVVYSLSDLGELAVRLGSIVSFDRRGDVLFFDDFEGGTSKWTYLSDGTGGSLMVAADRARNGVYSARLSPSTAVIKTSAMRRIFPFNVLSKMGFEVSFTLEDDILLYVFTLLIRDKTHYYSASLRYYPADDTIKINNNGTWVTLATNLSLYHYEKLFHTLKLVGDFGTPKKYARLILNETEYDLSAYNLLYTALAGDVYAQAVIEVSSTFDTNKYAYFDDIIITQNEP